MPAPTPLISIIVVCRNPGAPLRDALAGIWHQTLAAQTELIVIDGASTDGTAAWLTEHTSRIAHLCTEPDSGVYDAMNTGIAAARGEWIYFIGADDRLAAPNVLEKIAVLLRATSHDIVGAQARYSDGRLYATRPPLHPIRRNPLHHQSTFYRRSRITAHGKFDAVLRVAADYDFNLRLIGAGAVVDRSDVLVAHCQAGGLSDAGNWVSYGEEITVRHRHFPLWRSLPWDFVSCVRFVRKKLRRTLRSA
ncbi:glycosyltransferase family 2 protein [Synoicihabitans lomoniglobus]|uniref:Glycosyltransferase family 2 protein n=1 Tax=Synoicihabitans lomoniglobus TaxID=2909285 RepID=A0AAF0I837_9BACT|nr:glycosyltransferase [Opitutaceae bacterium LMO-M01]WED67276.1 glycosyltransferase family 2 protein [Opitutaceae bacterium LMO-M01]